MGLGIRLEPFDPADADALAIVGSIAGLRWIRCCETPNGTLKWDEPGLILSELSRRLVHRFQ